MLMWVANIARIGPGCGSVRKFLIVCSCSDATRAQARMNRTHARARAHAQYTAMQHSTTQHACAKTCVQGQNQGTGVLFQPPYSFSGLSGENRQSQIVALFDFLLYNLIVCSCSDGLFQEYARPPSSSAPRVYNGFFLAGNFCPNDVATLPLWSGPCCIFFCCSYR